MLAALGLAKSVCTMQFWRSNWQMSDIWQTFNLDPNIATERDVKQAYARLIKLHRPETDPEGFQRVRNCYEAALAELRGGQSKSLIVPAAGNCVGIDFSEEFELLESAIQSRIRQKIRIAWERIDLVAAEAGQRLTSITALVLCRFRVDWTLLSEVCTNERLMKHVENSDPVLPRVVIKQWGCNAEIRRLLEFAVTLNRAKHLSESSVTAQTMVQLALALGPWDPEAANRLAQKAFPNLPTTEKADLMVLLDREIMIGRLLFALPQDTKPFWLRLLKGAGEEINWSDPGSQRALIVLAKTCGPRWGGFALLQSVLSAERWAALLAAAQSLRY